MAYQQGNVVITWKQWQDSPYHQDKGSTIKPSAS